MKRILLPILGILLLAGCGKEQSTPTASEADQNLELRSRKVQILHYTGSATNPYEIIEVTDQAWMNAHMDHGDIIMPAVTLPDGSTLYVHPEDQTTGQPQNSNGVQWGGAGTDIANCSDLGDLPNYYWPDPYLDFDDAAAATLTDLDGAANTEKIVCTLGDQGNYAANVCDKLVAFGFNDWYLPSFGELRAMYEQLFVAEGGVWFPLADQNIVNNFNGYSYWSSTEVNADYAWYLNFANGRQDYEDKFFTKYSCRCVRR